MSGARRPFTRDAPCPNCGGWSTQRRGKDSHRCFGFYATGGRSFFCTRAEHAGDAEFNAGANGWKHWRYGACKCGLIHGEALPDGAVPALRPVLRVVEPEPEPADVDTLHRVYSRYLALSPLRAEHAAHLSRRGEADLMTARAQGYGSLPLGYTAARKVVEALIIEVGADVLATVPGFYRDRRTGQIQTHTATAQNDMIAIPARDPTGRIWAMARMRITGEGAKYMSFKGAGAEWAAFSGSFHAGAIRRVTAVEGIHKSLVTAYLLGQMLGDDAGIVMGLPGAHINDAHLQLLRDLAPDEIVEWLDADKFTHPPVMRQMERAHATLTALGARVLSAVHEAEDGKGADDLLKAGKVPRIRTIAHRPEVTARKPVPAPWAPMPKARPLAEIQRETERVIDDFIKHTRTKHGRVKIVAAPPGVGKTTAILQAAIKHRIALRIGVATKAKAEELAEAFPNHVRVVEGRNARNCGNFETVEAARDKKHDVAELVCAACPLISSCRKEAGGYYHQFEVPGILAGPSEMLFSGAFLRHGAAVVADDADLERVMIDTRAVRDSEALHLAAVVEPGPVRELLTVVQRAIDAERTAAGGFSLPKIGPHALDALARAAGTADRLVALIRACPPTADLLPSPADGMTLTAADINAAPSAVLARLVSLLQDEVGDFERGADFNSGISLHAGALELRTFRPPLWNEKENKAVLKDKAVMVLDATPLMPLIERFAEGLTIEPIYAPTVALPANVHVTQIADRSHAKTSVTQERKRQDGSTATPGRDRVLASLEAARADFPGDREAVICAKGLRDYVVAAGIDPERVLTFYANRGLNTIEDADVLHVLGRPQAPDWTAIQDAHVLYKGGSPIIGHLAMKPVAYDGYRAPDGHGRAIEVLDFTDPRISAVFQQRREMELVQSIHRARLFRVSDAQTGLFDSSERVIARTAGERRRVRVIVHSSQPIPGLRVDALVYDEAAAPSVNDRRALEATARILAARNALIAEGVPVSAAAVARLAGANRLTAARVLASVEDSTRPDQTVISSLSTKGLIRAYQISQPPLDGLGSPNAPPAPRVAVAGVPARPP